MAARSARALMAMALVAAVACGVSTAGGGSESGPIKVGIMVPLTGTFAANGKNE